MGLDLSQFGSGGNKPFSWNGKAIGDRAKGKLLESRSQQQKEYKGPGKPPGEPLFWKDGNPRMQLVLTLQTNEREPGDEQDEGARDVYLPAFGDSFKRLIRAVAAHGSETLEDGADVEVIWISGAGVTGDGRQFDYTYTPPVKGTSLSALPQPQEAVTPAPAPQPAPVPAAAPVAPQAAVKTITQAQADAFAAMGIELPAGVVVSG